MPNCPENSEDKTRNKRAELRLKSRQGKSAPTGFFRKPTIGDVIEKEEDRHLQEFDIRRRIAGKRDFHSQGTTQEISQEPNRGE
jgi:hypothetical protein